MIYIYAVYYVSKEFTSRTELISRRRPIKSNASLKKIEEIICEKKNLEDAVITGFDLLRVSRYRKC